MKKLLGVLLILTATTILVAMNNDSWAKKLSMQCAGNENSVAVTLCIYSLQDKNSWFRSKPFSLFMPIDSSTSIQVALRALLQTGFCSSWARVGEFSIQAGSTGAQRISKDSKQPLSDWASPGQEIVFTAYGERANSASTHIIVYDGDFSTPKGWCALY